MTNRDATIWNTFLPLYSAWTISLLATLGALFVGEILGQTPCLLCWYQRIAMFPLAVLLGIASLNNDGRIGRYATPLSATGSVLASWHVLVFYEVVPTAIEPCGQGPSCRGSDMTVLGGVPLPVLSLVAFVSILGFLHLVARRGTHE
jgi:disulfide bond formation protein DsbB